MLWLFVIIFCFEQFEDVESKIFIVRLSLERVQSSAVHNFRPHGASASSPEAKRRCTWRRSPARSRLQSSCSQKEPRWTPRTTVARGLRAMARNPVSNLGHLNNVFRDWNLWETCLHLQQMLGKSCGFPPQKVWNQWSQYNMSIYVWRMDDL